MVNGKAKGRKRKGKGTDVEGISGLLLLTTEMKPGCTKREKKGYSGRNVVILRKAKDKTPNNDVFVILSGLRDLSQ